MKRLDLPTSSGGLRLVSSIGVQALHGAERFERQQWERRGKVLVMSGLGAALAGVLVYCVACIAARSDADLADIVHRGAVPYARAGLFLIGCGTLTWVIGSVAAHALLDARRGER